MNERSARDHRKMVRLGGLAARLLFSGAALVSVMVLSRLFG